MFSKNRSANKGKCKGNIGNLCKTPRARHTFAANTLVPNVRKGGITLPLGFCRGVIGSSKRNLYIWQTIGLALFGASSCVWAASLGNIAQNTAGSFDAVGAAAQAFFGLCGLILIGASIFTFIKYNKTEGQGAKLSTAFVYMIGGGLLFYVASLIQTTADTVWGDNGGSRGRITIQR